MAVYTDYTPVGPWKDGVEVTRKSDGVIFLYNAQLNALMITSNKAGISKDANNNAIINLPLPSAGGDAANRDYVDQRVLWVPYVGSPQSFLAQNMTRDGDWTMIANKDTSDRPAPQSTGPEQDLLPAWTPTVQQARASYSVLNEWTLSQAGWLDQYGTNIINAGAVHTIALSVNGTTVDTYTATPIASGMYWHNVVPVLIKVGSVVRVTVQVTIVGNNYMQWNEQDGLFAAAPIYSSLAQGSKDGAAMSTNAYDCHVLFTPGAVSPDWDIVAFGSSIAGSALQQLMNRVETLEMSIKVTP
jgi:hypothetical protein